MNRIQLFRRITAILAHASWLFAAMLVLCSPATLYAQASSSTNYSVEQTFFGTGGELNACSASYCAKQTAGELGVGNTASANYQAYAGFNTTDDPYLEFVVTGNNIDLNYLDTAIAKTATGTFAVRAWQSGGYAVQTQSDPPVNPSGGHQLTPMATAGPSTPGTEQFGINLVANGGFGADPQQVPDATFSFGHAEPGYDVADVFKYAKGDIVARSNQSTSITVYTVSYIFNIDQFTPSGQYKFVHNLVATATY
jgi:hypothetical protein